MSDQTIGVTFPLDEGVFLRRQCPNCGREFKWYSDEAGTADDTSESIAVPTHYFCPYCHESSAIDDWWTEAQRQYVAEIVNAQVVIPALQDFQRNMSTMNRPGGVVRFESKPIGFAEPEPLVEPNDMIRIDFPCHPEEPIKVDEEWRHPLACLVCGIRYPAELVKPLGETRRTDQ